jgi:hypothetical protein
MTAKSVTWSSSGNKVSVRIVERLDNTNGIEFWNQNQHFSTVISIEEAEAIANAITYFKNQKII